MNISRECVHRHRHPIRTRRSSWHGCTVPILVALLLVAIAIRELVPRPKKRSEGTRPRPASKARRHPPKEVEGTLVRTDDAIHDGFQLAVRSVRPIPHPGRAFVLEHPEFSGALLTLSSTTPEGHHVHGTAFLVAPGIAMTAAHTIQGWMAEGHFERPNYAMFALSTYSAELRTWEIRQCVIPAQDGDVALLMLAPRFEITSGVEIVHFELTAIAPSSGAEVFAIGTRLEPPDEILPMKWPGGAQRITLATVTSSGPIREYFPQGTPLLKAPCFAADIFTVGGMSGGPVFDRRGMVVGVISRSFESQTVEEWTTFVALPWPALTFEFEAAWPPHMFPAGTTLKAMTEEGFRVGVTDDGHLFYRGELG